MTHVIRTVYSRNGQVNICGSSGIPALKMTGDSGGNAQIYATGSKYGMRLETTEKSGNKYCFHATNNENGGLIVLDNTDVGIGMTIPTQILEISSETTSDCILLIVS